MKKLLAILMAIAMLIPALGGVQLHVSAADAADTTGTTGTTGTGDITPFMMVNWDPLDKEYSNIFDLPKFLVVRSKLLETGNWVMEWDDVTDIKELALKLKDALKDTPEGCRFMQVATYTTFLVMTEDVIFHDEGVELLRDWLDRFLTEYKAIGGELDGIPLDTEYILSSAYYLCTEQYKKGNEQIYQQIQDNPKYQQEVRPMLEERGFVFYQGEGKSELFCLHNDLQSTYSKSRSIWDKVMSIRKAEYLTRAIAEPLLKHYPDAQIGEYDTVNSYAWMKGAGDSGYSVNVTGNGYEFGNSSNMYTYAHRPSYGFFAYGGGYPPAYNKAVIEDNAFDGFLWDMRAFKNAQAAFDDDGVFNVWVTYYDYRIGKANRNKNTVSGTPYHTETMYHVGLLDPKPFLGYFIPSEIAGETGTKDGTPEASVEYNKRLQNLSDILSELTRIVGMSDRKPIEYPGTWNSDFVISGMYAGGRNVWRITPDTTKGVTLEQFKVRDDVPTFRISGQTVVFPQGKIIEENRIEPYGSCGYWVETPVDVEPVVINDTDRYSKYPSYEENFDGYENGATFDKKTAEPSGCWEITGNMVVKDGALGMSGVALLENKKIPARITAGDSFAKQQAWQVTVTLPENLQTTQATLLNCAHSDGFRVKDGKLQYSEAGTYKDLMEVAPNGKYTVKREVDFTTAGAYKSSYYVYDTAGALLAEQKNVAMVDVQLPVASIGFIGKTAVGQWVLLDDYKLWPMGIATDFELYDAATGLRVTEETNAGATAYRLSWLNGSAQTKKATIVAEYYDGANLVSTKTVREVIMSPGADGVETEIVPLNEGKSVKLRMETADCADVVWPDFYGTEGTENTGETEKKGLDLIWIVLIALGAVLVAAGVAVAIVTIVKKKR